MTERMTFESAWVNDPLRRGEIALPIFCVRVNVWPDETIQPKTFDGGWTVSKHGVFTKFVGPEPESDSGDFNKRFANTFPSVVDLRVYCDDEYTDEYALYLKRSRVLLRRDAPNWRLLLSDTDAQKGRTRWLPSERNAPCKFWEGTDICGATATGIVRIEGLEVPYCRPHTELHNEDNKNRRLQKTS